MSSTSADPLPVGLRLWPLAAGALALTLTGLVAWWIQFTRGLVVTGLGRDVTWGLYISQFTFFVGVAASAVMVVIPYYLHDLKAFRRLLVLGEALALSAVVTAGLFVFVDLGQPARVMNVLLHPSPRSPMFWDMLCLGGYFVLNLLIGGSSLVCERYRLQVPRWQRPLVLLSIPWAVSIHTVTAFLYAGLPGRASWETAVLAPRFLASAFASGPALLLLVVLATRRWGIFEAGTEAVRGLSRIMAWGLAASLFLLGAELFTTVYSHNPEELEALRALYLEPSAGLWVWAWGAVGACVLALGLLLRPAGENRLVAAAVLTFLGVWAEKGMSVVVGGLQPSPLGVVPGYQPQILEILIALGVWGVGLLFFTVTLGLVRQVREG